MAEIFIFSKNKDMDNPHQQELYTRVLSLVHEYDDELTIASCVGVLELAKDTIMNHLRP